MTNFASTRKNTAAFKVAVLILNEGPLNPAQIFSRVHCGETGDSRRTTLERAIKNGWFIEGSLSGLIYLTDEAEAYLRSLPAEEIEPTWSKATGPTINMLTRPPLSQKYMLNPRGTRQDQPEWSKRPEGFTLRTVA